MRHAAITSVLITAAAVALIGQTPPDPAFEVASIRSSKPGEVAIGQRWTRDEYRATNMPLFVLIQQAFGRSQANEIVGGPAWLKTDRWDIVAKADTPGGAMAIFPRVRTLLAERFKLRTHVETRTLPLYALVLARADRQLGPRLRPSAEGSRFQQGFGVFTARATPIGILVNTLAAAVQAKVVDRTGLTDKYDIDLHWAPDTAPLGDAPPPAPDAPSIFTAVQEQLGLKLESTRGPVEVLVIDSVERPTED